MPGQDDPQRRRRWRRAPTGRRSASPRTGRSARRGGPPTAAGRVNQSWLAARRPDRLGTSRTSTKYMTSPPAELRSSIPSMVPIDRRDQVAQHDRHGVPDREVPDRRRTGDGAADDVPDRPDHEGEQHGGDRHGDRRQGLGPDHPSPAGDVGERRQPAALAPLAGDRQQGDHRQDHRDREPDRLGEVVVRQVLVRRERDGRDRGDEAGDRDARDQPESRAGVEHLAELDADDPAERDGRELGTSTGRGPGRWWWRSCRCPLSLGVGGELEEHLLESATVGVAELGEHHAAVVRRASDQGGLGVGAERSVLGDGRRERRLRPARAGGRRRPRRGRRSRRPRGARPWSPGRRSAPARSSRCRRR